MIEVLIVTTLVGAALLTGNEFAVGAFIHPSLSRLETKTHVAAVQEIGRVYGKIMPFWMGGTVLFCLSLVLLAAPWYSEIWWFFVAATLFYAGAVVFSLLGPVPINNQVIKWDDDNLPDDWRKLRRRWDNLHSVRIAILIIGFVCLAAGVTLR